MEEEQRVNKRVPIAATARISCRSNEGSKSIESTVASISFLGIGLYADYVPTRDTAVSVEITFIATDGQLRTDAIKGNIVNATEVVGLRYLCVVFKEKVNRRDQPHLYEHLHSIIDQD